MPFIRALKKDGHEVHAAYKDNSAEKPGLDLYGIDKVFEIPFERSPFRLSNIRAYRELKKVIQAERYDIIHCNTPMGGVVTRLAAKKSRAQGTRVIYTAHGFHFYKGAPLKNWLLYYPVEWLLAHWTDVLVTINKEDYARAQRHMHSKQVEYVPGVGIDLQKFAPNRLSQEEKDCLRESIGVGKEDKLLLSVGELNANKNHAVVIRAIAKLQNPSLHYAIVGVGELRDELLNLAGELGISGQVHLLGYRNDVADLYQAADICVFPSIREGLGLAAIEGMASGLPLICADNRGTRDYAFNGENAIVCKFDDIQQFARALTIMLTDTELSIKMGNLNKERAKRYDVNSVIVQMKEIYRKSLDMYSIH